MWFAVQILCSIYSSWMMQRKIFIFFGWEFFSYYPNPLFAATNTRINSQISLTILFSLF